MPALLAMIPVKDWLYGGLIVLLIVCGIHVHHKLIAEGIAEQKAADDKAVAALTQQTAKQTAELQAKATMAEQAYAKELQSLNDQPSLQPVRLCLDSHSRGPVLSKGGAQVGGNQAAGASPGDVLSMPAGDSGGGDGAGPDISSLLGLLASRADELSAELREDQARE